MPLFVIDCGHGGDRSVGRSTADGLVGYGGIREKDVTLALGRKLLDALGPDAALTRTDDRNLSLAARASAAGRFGAVAFLSLHAASDPRRVDGARAWIHSRASERSRVLAEGIVREMARYGGASPAVSRSELAVLSPAALPHDTAACLLEVDNLAHRAGAQRLGDPRSVEDIAHALARSLRAYGSSAPAGALDDDTIGAGITIRPGSGIESVRLSVPNVGEFEINPSDVHDWLVQHGIVRSSPPAWTDLDRRLFDAIRNGRPRPSRHPEWEGQGNYQWNDFSIRRNQPGLTTGEREAIDEEQAHAWGRMLKAWALFRQQIDVLASASDAATIVRAIGNALTALARIERSDFPSPYREAFDEWTGLEARATLPSLQTAARAVAAAGRTLHDRWHAAIGAGNYNSNDLWPQHRAFVAACRSARTHVVMR